MKRALVSAVICAAAVVSLSVPAGAHVIVVDTPGEGAGHSGWAGSPAAGIPGQGEGLVLGGHTGETVLSPAHVKGLVSACEAIRAHGQAAVDIFGPPTPAGCPHGT